ncbi:MAG: hypothetical protein K1W02_09800 [Muribaculaceae bacterium]
MVRAIKIGRLNCLCEFSAGIEKIAYVLYPMNFLSGWISGAADRYGINIVVITGMEWEDVFSPWPAKGVPDGSPDFKGESPEFLKQLQTSVIPKLEETFGLTAPTERTLVGISMSGLFSMWQWLVCDTFDNIASLSGSFWYEGFVDWVRAHTSVSKRGKAYFLLGKQESRSNVKAFNSVADDTREIVAFLKSRGINTEFESVPGNHYSDPLPRLEKAFTALYG